MEKLFQGQPEKEKRGGRGPEIKDTNYFYIYKKDLPGIDISTKTGDKEYYGKLQVKITALQELFIGLGQVESKNNRLYDTFSSVKEGPAKSKMTIPGSSMKGCTLTNLMLFVNPKSTGFLSAKDEMARVFFTDFPIQDQVELVPKTIAGRFTPRFSPDDAVIKMYRKEDLAYSNLSPEEFRKLQSKENILVIPKNTVFKGYVSLQKVNLYQLTFLLLALGCVKDHRFNYKMGGAKNRGLGMVKTELDAHNSFFTGKLLQTIVKEKIPYSELEPQLLTILNSIKQDHPNFTPLLEKIQKEYSHD